MSFEGEWRGLHAEAATRVRLNGTGGGTGAGAGANKGATSGESGDLVVRQDDLGRVGHEAFLLHARLKRAGDMTRGAKDEGSTAKAASTLTRHHFSLGDALTTAATIWNDQYRTLLQACAHISNSLDHAKKSQTHTDAKIGASMTHRDGSAMSVSEISRYYR